MEYSDKKQLVVLASMASLAYLIMIGFAFDYASPGAYLIVLSWVVVCALSYEKLSDRVDLINLKRNFLFISLFVSILLVALLGVNRVLDKSIEYTSCSFKNMTMSQPQSDLTNLDLVALDLYGNPVQNISPVKLNSTFELGGNGTNLQRENVENSIKGKVVVWKLKVYEIRRKKDGTFRIQTETGNVDRRSEIQQTVQAFMDIGNIFSGRGAVLSDRYENQNVGTFINLTLRHDGDLQYLGNLQTGSWITIRGKITGVSLRNVDIAPAVLEHKDNTVLYTQAYDRKKEFERKLDSYNNRSCSHVWSSAIKVNTSNQKAVNSWSASSDSTGRNVDGEFSPSSQFSDLEALIKKTRENCRTPIADARLPNGLIDRYRVFVDVNAETVIFMNMAASDTLLEIYDLKNKKYGQLLSYKNSLLISSLLTPNFFDTQVVDLLDEKSCNLVNGRLHHENFFSCSLKNNVWYADPNGGSGYECKWLNK